MQHAEMNDGQAAEPVKRERRRPGSPLRAKTVPVALAKPVFQQLHRFAALLQGRAVPGDSPATAGISITREVLSAAADDLGLRLVYEAQDLKVLKDRDFPCLVPLDDGTAYIATGLQNKQVLLVEHENTVQAVPFAQFIDNYSGIVMQLQPVLKGKPVGEQAKAGPHEQSETQDEPKLATKILQSILAHNKARLMQLAMAAILSNLLLVVLPLFMMSVYDRIIPHLAMETLWALAIGVLVALVVDLGLRISRASLIEAIATSVSNRTQGQFYNRLMHLEMSSMPRLAGGLAGAIQEFDNLCRVVPQALVALIIDLPFFVLILGLLYYMGGAVVIAPVLGILIIAIANLVTYSKSREVNASSTELMHKRSNQLIETLGAIETIKSTRSENRLLALWEQRTDEGAWLSYLARHQTGFASHLTIITVQVTIVMTLVIGVYELQAGGITMGALAASSLLVGRAMAPMGNLIALFVRGFHILRSSSAIEQVLTARQEATGDRQSANGRKFKGLVNFNNINFSYAEGQAPVLKNISFEIRPGERVGLIGRIGCGKSTLLKLLPRLHQASTGSLLFDGHDIRQYAPSFLRTHMALMPQEALLVEGSLRDNICLGMDQVSEAEYQRVVEISGVLDFASVHPQGYGMQVGPRGENLSGGERAGVVLARTLLRQPDMLLLDEPTAAMDNDLERRIVSSLDTWLGNRSLILATHRAPLLALVDRIIWLHNGQIIADGPRDDVLAKLKG